MLNTFIVTVSGYTGKFNADYVEPLKIQRNTNSCAVVQNEIKNAIGSNDNKYDYFIFLIKNRIEEIEKEIVEDSCFSARYIACLESRRDELIKLLKKIGYKDEPEVKESLDELFEEYED